MKDATGRLLLEGEFFDNLFIVEDIREADNVAVGARILVYGARIVAGIKAAEVI